MPDAESLLRARSTRQSADPARRIPGTALRVLWIDDQAEPGDPTVRLLGCEGIQVTVAYTAAEGLRLAVESRYDAILLDVQLPDLFGLTALRRLRALGVGFPVVILTGWYMEPEVEGDARRLGAAEFLRKPLIGVDQLTSVLRAVAGSWTAEHPAEPPRPHLGVVAVSPVMREVLAWAEAVGPRAIPVLLTGETGTGKEVVARALHEASRRSGPFIALNCGAIPDTLFESELFGHAKGAYTGAINAKPGFFEEAHGGTLMLDEVGELSLSQQVRLLRALDTGEVRRLGEMVSRKLDVRIIAATNRSLHEEVACKRFRQDLYYRLNGAARHLPPLRERPDDIDALVRYWAARHRATDGAEPVWVGPDALNVLRAQPWHGNARELRSVLERAVCLLRGSVLREHEIVAALSESIVPTFHVPAGAKRDRAAAALRMCGGKAERAAAFLGISRGTLYRWLGPGGRPVNGDS